MNHDKELRDFFFSNIQENLLHLVECGQKLKALSLFEVYYTRVKDSYRKARTHYKNSNNTYAKDSCEKNNDELTSTALLYAETLYYYSYYLNIAGDNLKSSLCLKHAIKLFETLSLPNSESKEIYYKAKVDRINILLDKGQFQKAEDEAQRLLHDVLNLESMVYSLNSDLIFNIYNAIISGYFFTYKIKEAEDIIRELLNRCLKYTGENKISTLLRGNLVIALKCQNRYMEACDLGRKYLDGCMSFFGKDSHQAIKAKKILADIYFCIRRNFEFEELSEEIVRQLTDNLGEDHPETLKFMNEAAYAYLALERYEKAFKWYEKAAELGDKDAQRDLGTLYYDGIGVERDYSKAFKWMKKSAEGEDGDPQAQSFLGAYYAEGTGTDYNTEEAIKWFKKAAELGEPKSQINLGLMYKNGTLNGTPKEKDPEKALFWIEKAVGQGDSDAQAILGSWYYEGTVVKQDYDEAFKLFEKAAEQGSAEARLYLGIMFINGEGTNINVEKGCRLVIEAAEQGNAEAQFFLAQWYYDGMIEGGSKSDAVEWFRKAAEQGWVKAQSFLGAIYLTDESIRDYEEAYKWLKSAAEKNDAIAQFNLGLMYWHGIYVKRDVGKAKEWIQKAAAQGHERAIGFLNSIENKGSGEE